MNLKLRHVSNRTTLFFLRPAHKTSGNFPRKKKTRARTAKDVPLKKPGTAFHRSEEQLGKKIQRSPSLVQSRFPDGSAALSVVSTSSSGGSSCCHPCRSAGKSGRDGFPRPLACSSGSVPSDLPFLAIWNGGGKK
jgi:hypothetical protein